ncbi:MAG: ankyrin repeat domain-containing protein [Verrucomicrobiales bacterium]
MRTALLALFLFSLSGLGYTKDFTIDDLTRSCREGNLNRVKEIVASGVDVSAKDQSGWFPLSVAAAHGQVEVIKCLIDQGADVNERTSKQNTPLIFAASRGHLPAVEFLLKLGADPKLTNRDGETAAASANDGGYPDVAKAIDTFRVK